MWDNWIAMSLLAAGAWAVSSVIDVCFVGAGIYRKPSDGPIIAGLFCVVPILTTTVTTTGIGDFGNSQWHVALVSMASGVVYLLHVFFYFKALFKLNDASNAEIFNTLSVLVIPLLAFFVLGENLTTLAYVAVVLAAVGILLLVRIYLLGASAHVLLNLMASVLCISATMVMQAWTLEQSSYSAAIWWFSAGAFLAVVVVLCRNRSGRQRISSIWRRFGFVLVGVQMLEMAGIFSSQRATDVGPSVSMVALLECTLPIFIMLFSWLTVQVARKWNAPGAGAIQSALKLQTTAAPAKLVAMFFILTAIVVAQ